MATHDFLALEEIEAEACIDLYRAAPEAVRSAHEISITELPGSTCLMSRGIEPASIFRRVLGLGIRHATNELELGGVIAGLAPAGQRFCIPVAPESRPTELESWLRARGFTPGYGWMKFWRPCERVSLPSSELDVRLATSARAGEFGRVLCEGFGLPGSTAPWLGALAERAGWTCLLAFDGEQAVAAGAAYVQGERAWLGLGATLPSHRRRGAQNVLLARRLDEVARQGARIAVTETGERLPDKPSNSYRNILRAGFQEAYVRQNYLSPA